MRRLPLSKYLVYLLAYLLEEWHSRDVLHYQVNIHSIVVGLVVFNNAGVIECMQCSYLIHDIGQIVAKFVLIEHLYRHFDICIVLVRCQEYFAKGASSENFCLGINVVILLELMHALLAEALACNELLFLNVLLL